MFLFMIGIVFVVIACTGIALVLRQRRAKERKRLEDSLSRWMQPPAYTLGIPEHPGLVAVRAEMDASQRRYEQRLKAEGRRQDFVPLFKRRTS